MSALPPGLLLIAAGLVLPLVGPAARQAVVLAAPLASLWLCWTMGDGAQLSLGFLDYTLTPVVGDNLSRLFGIVFSIMAFAGGLFALRQERLVELVAAYVYAGSAIGAVFAGDLVTLFIFWELMAVGSGLVIWAAATRAAYRASMRYIAIHLAGGVILMFGILMHVAETGDVAVAAMTDLLRAGSPAAWLMLAGVLVNVGAPPLWGWIADAYPEASWSGAVFLSAFTTKTAVYVLLRGFPGAEPLVAIGLVMVVYGLVYALLENDLRRLLAYAIVNQAGFMVTGIGLGGAMALNGAAAHAVASILYTALLFMAAGAVLRATGRRGLVALGGLARTMKWTAAAALVGGLTLSALPLTAGFVSKSMILQAAIDAHLGGVWYILTAASAGAFVYAGLKLPWFAFFAPPAAGTPPTADAPADPPASLRAAMLLLAALCVFIGVWPQALYALLPFPVDYVPYTGAHIVALLQLVAGAGLAAVALWPLLRPARTISLDLDWLYRKVGRIAARETVADVAGMRTRLEAWVRTRLAALAALAAPMHPKGALARTLEMGNMVLWVVVALGVFGVMFFVGR